MLADLQPIVCSIYNEYKVVELNNVLEGFESDFFTIMLYEEENLDEYTLFYIGGYNEIRGLAFKSGRKIEDRDFYTLRFAKAIEDAKKNLVRIPLNKATLPHEQKGKFGGARVYVQPASHGTGVIAGGAMRAVFEVLGVHNVFGKVYGSTNPVNVVKATLNGLKSMVSPETIAAKRGKTITELFKVPSATAAETSKEAKG